MRFRPGTYDLFAKAITYNQRMPNVYTMGAWYADAPNEDERRRRLSRARELLAWSLQKFPDCPGRMEQWNIVDEYFRYYGVRDSTTDSYPAAIVSALMTIKRELKCPNMDSGAVNIVVTMTTCKRFDLFSRTINSFLQCCTDAVDRVSRWIVVDDNSSEEDRRRMEKLYPFFDFVWKTPEQRGHAKSMNMLQKEVAAHACGATHVFHMEDDWLFVERQPYLTRLLDVMMHCQVDCQSTAGSTHGGAASTLCGQVLINHNYAERHNDDHIRIVSGAPVETTPRGGVEYRRHRHIPVDTPEYNQFMSRLHVYQGSHVYWPHYSLRPGLLDVRVWDQSSREVTVSSPLDLHSGPAAIGGYNEQDGHFELEYARRYTTNGWTTAFLNGVSCLHIGKLTSQSDKDVPSAYALNDTNRFQ